MSLTTEQNHQLKQAIIIYADGLSKAVHFMKDAAEIGSGKTFIHLLDTIMEGTHHTIIELLILDIKGVEIDKAASILQRLMESINTADGGEVVNFKGMLKVYGDPVCVCIEELTALVKCLDGVTVTGDHHD